MTKKRSCKKKGKKQEKKEVSLRKRGKKKELQKTRG
jgi:hypothetical protein